MFSRNDIDLAQIRPSSKITLKLSCLAACGHDVDRAERLYNYLAADLSELPDVDPVQPSAVARVISGADTVAGWISAHQGDIMQVVTTLRGLRSATGTAATVNTAAAGVPPIPDTL